MKKFFVGAAAAMMAFSMMPEAASAQSLFARANRVTVEQHGNGNGAAVAQNGRANVGGVIQRGNGQTGIVQQTGNNNVGGVNQRGNNNTGTLVQDGNNNAGCLLQRGNNLNGEVYQNGNDRGIYLQTNRTAMVLPAGRMMVRACAGG
jgi:hypothetical protein